MTTIDYRLSTMDRQDRNDYDDYGNTMENTEGNTMVWLETGSKIVKNDMGVSLSVVVGVVVWLEL